MSKVDDLRAALECREPAGAVPIWELHFHCWEQVAGRHYIGRPEFDSLSSNEQRNALSSNADIIVEAAERLQFAGVTIPDPPWDCMYTLPPESRIELVRLLKERSGGDFLIFASCPGTIGMPSSEEYLEFSYKLFDAPEEIDVRAQSTFERGVEMAHLLAEAGVDAVYTAADIADNKGPWYSPDQLDRYIYPYLRKWSEELRALGLYTILHTDGEITPMLDELSKTGIHAVQAVDPVAGMDIASAKKIVDGRLCLCGNVDCGLLIVGEKKDIYESTCQILRTCKTGGGLVLGASNAVVVETPIDNYLQIIRAWEDEGSYQ